MVEEVLKNIDKFRLIGDRLSAYKLAAHFKIGLTQAYQLKYMVEERLRNAGKNNL
jgi:hypothetical protein